MRKIILFSILLIIFAIFVVFFVTLYQKQKEDSGATYNNQIPSVDNSDIEVKRSYYINYSKLEYDKAISENRVVLLYFTSNWCEDCTTQSDVNTDLFDELIDDGIAGLVVHILDSETTIETDALALKFDISKEQSFVILDKNGVVHFKHTGTLGKELLKEKILEAR